LQEKRPAIDFRQPPSKCLIIVCSYLLEGIKNPCVIFVCDRMNTGYGNAIPAWGRWWCLLGRRSSSASFMDGIRIRFVPQDPFI